MTYVGGDIKDYLIPTLCHGQGCQAVDQAAQGPTQSVFECLSPHCDDLAEKGCKLEIFKSSINRGRQEDQVECFLAR